MLRSISLFNRLFDEEFDNLFTELSYSSKKDKTVYYKNGMVHNENGPAIVYKDGKENEYWLEGKKVTKEDVETYQQNKENEKLHEIWISNKSYSIKGKYLKELKEKIEELSKKC